MSWPILEKWWKPSHWLLCGQLQRSLGTCAISKILAHVCKSTVNLSVYVKPIYTVLPFQDIHWTLVSNNLKTTSRRFTIKQLEPETSYELRIRANNEAGDNFRLHRHSLSVMILSVIWLNVNMLTALWWVLFCWVSFCWMWLYSVSLCWISLCWMSLYGVWLCWMWLCWMSFLNVVVPT